MLFKLFIIVSIFFAQQDQRIADRVVAIVNDEPILLSEINQSSPAGLVESERLPEMMKARLEGRINQTLILQEVKRLKLFTIDIGRIESMKAALISQHGSEEALNEDLKRRGLTPKELDAWLQRYLLINSFIDYNFRRSIQIDEVELQDYYQGTFVPGFEAENPETPVPTFESRRDVISALLKERLVNLALENWLDEARSRARIVIKY